MALSSPERNQSIELVRIIAAFGVVLFHSTGSEIGYAGLTAFTMIATYFGGGRSTARRIMLPWLFWSVFYLGWRYVADGSPFHDGLTPLQSILYGTHLWFLPFIFVAVTASRLTWDKLPLACAIIGLAFCLATPWWRAFYIDMDPPVAQWLNALPAAFMGVGLRSQTGRWIVGAGVLVCLAYMVPGASIPMAIGGGAVIAALVLPSIRHDMTSVSSCMMGVYLVHIAALGIANRIVGEGTPLTALLAFCASLAGVWIARWVPLANQALGLTARPVVR